MPGDRPVEMFDDQEAWRAWLDAHHVASDGLWIKFAKKGSGASTPSYEEVLDVALCYGWIDSQVKRLDERFYLQAFTPRRARSPWSKRNVDKVAALIEADLMRPAGIAEVERAQADGRWAKAYEGPAKAEAPQDFLDALAQNAEAQAFYQTLNGHNLYAIYYRVQDAKRPETRARRIATFVDMLARGEKLH